MKKLISLLLCLTMLLSVIAIASSCEPSTPVTPNNTEQPGTTDGPANPTDASANPTDAPDVVKTYTYHTYSTSLGDNWNPHTWETSGDDSILGYLSSPLVDLSIKNSETGEYQWVYEMAASIEDVTKDHQDDLTKFGAVLPEGKTAADVTEGYVWEIKLNPNCKWENGTPINADTYVYSMKALLDPKMRNYRSNLYWSGESAVAGGNAYYNSGAPLYNCVAWNEATGKYDTDLDAAIASGFLYINPTSTNYELYSESLSSLFSTYAAYLADEQSGKTISGLVEQANAFGYVKITSENKEAIFAALYDLLENVFGIPEADVPGVLPEALFYWDGASFGEVVDYDATVGCYKVDDYTIRYVCQTYIDRPQFLVACSSNWLVYQDLYESNKDTTGELVTTKYGTSIETTMSYGTYKIESFQEGKQIVFVRNENWYGWEKDEKGNLVSYTKFLVDGEKRQQYQTEKIVIDVMTDDAAKLNFLSGKIDDWTPNADELTAYSSSEQLYRVDETYSMSLFFNTNLEALQEMDRSKGNTNSVVLSNYNFRNAFSLAIDRAEWVTATAGYKPLYGFMGKLYYYDVWNDPASIYRTSDAGMQAICNVKYGEGTPYATLKDAYDSITGYNITQAKALMKTACEELVAAGLYKAGDPIYIRVGYKKGALDSSDNQQVSLLQKYLNAAIDGSGFGTITLEAVGSIKDRYGDVRKGEFCIGYGGWGGAAFYPFRNFQVYMDPESYDLHEGACWDPTTYTFTFVIDGEEVTKTAQQWSNSMVGTGEYAERDNTFKLKLTAMLEEAFIKLYYRIPLANSTACNLLSYKVAYYTEDYNIMYGFGGLRLMTYKYSDAEWDDFVKQNNGELKYE